MKLHLPPSPRLPRAGWAASGYLVASCSWTVLTEISLWQSSDGRPFGWRETAGYLGFGVLSAGVIYGMLRLCHQRVERARTRQHATARRHATLLGSSPDYIHVLDAELKLIEANPAFYRSLGYGAENRPASLRLADWSLDASAEALLKKIGASPGRSEVFMMTQRDGKGRRREVEISASAVEWERQTILFCVGRDLTERRRQQLREAREDRLENLERFSGGIAHELNNALAPIMLGAELLRERHPGLGADPRLNSITGAARRAADVVHRVLAFAHGMDGDRLPVDLQALLEALAGEIEAVARPGLTVRREIAAGLPKAKGDAEQLRRILRELAANAVEAMGWSAEDPAGGTSRGVLTLGLRARTLDAAEAKGLGGLQPGMYLECFLRDTGPGLTEDARRHLFTPFFTTKLVKSGAGLNLATALGLARGHDGVIEQVDPKEGGTEFRLLLPTPEPESITTPAQ